MQINGLDAKVLYTNEEIKDKVKELGKQIAEDYKGKELLVLALLNGAFVFAADLVRAIDMDFRVEFMKSSSYGDETTSSGKVKILFEPDLDYSKYDVLIVDDILDTGITMKAIVKSISEKNPKSVKTCTFLSKPERREVEIEPDYVGYSIPNKFVIGYGLNFKDYYRNLPDILYLE